ncbi:hydroxyacylglutathione hydrolase [Galdieria sulphuraria]|uniref:hydroxyacylglutathione hydrolase n=1 Tax=Galdieria sulphuraria TaxID=130081 RepID=M2Y3W5_GALSU|nr:hydroxyacylglutathione hydrolase [Galdieria sulphuraria]EME30514.1 hydroxyacylglutathione hydrolase [Galdieria sulphuraria]|eukprot:XP_005707034.1 hydroxyacylglutathione hydrolase [Galdieria sulphuraria]
MSNEALSPIARVVTIPVLSDNYAYLLIDTTKNVAAAIDPAEPEKVLEVATKERVKLTHVLTTHKHWDHAAGNKKMAELVFGITIVGGELDEVDGATLSVKDGQIIHVGNICIKALHTPCHTKGHICYYVTTTDSSPPQVFTGDTLFIAGCGKFFEGTAKDMFHSLLQVLRVLPLDTRVWCGHEYTVKNLQFAKTVETNNSFIQTKLAWAEQRRSLHEPTVPSTLSEEVQYNPFMRVTEKKLQESLRMLDSDPVDILAYLRKQKDNF